MGSLYLLYSLFFYSLPILLLGTSVYPSTFFFFPGHPFILGYSSYYSFIIVPPSFITFNYLSLLSLFFYRFFFVNLPRSQDLVVGSRVLQTFFPNSGYTLLVSGMLLTHIWSILALGNFSNWTDFVPLTLLL